MPGTTVEELLSHGAWARRLAAALIADRHEADDLVQDTWVSALRHPPSGSGSTKAWMGRVMRNLASNRRRENARRVEREASVARAELQPSSDDVAQELEMHRALVDALASIDPDQARTIVRRYFHGLSSAEIAREERVPESTVRNRLMRGLDALRAKLDSKYGRRDAWVALLLPLTRKGSTVVVGASVGGGMLLLGKLAVAGILVAVGSVSLWSWRQSEGARPIASASSSPSAVVLDATAPVDGRATIQPEATQHSDARESGAAPPPSAESEDAPSWLETRVVDASGSPIQGAELLVIDRLEGGEIDASAAPRAASGADGRIRLEVRKSDRLPNRGFADRNRLTLRVRISAQACESVQLDPAIAMGSVSSMGEITLRPGGIVRGRVVCDDTLPAKLWVELLTPELSLKERASLRFGFWRKGVGYARVGVDGSYESSGLRVGTYRAMMSGEVVGYFSACSEPFEVRAGETTLIPDLVLEQNPNTIQGRIVRADGEPLGFRDIEYIFVPSTSASNTERLAVGTDVDRKTGRFVIDLPRAGICDLFARDHGKNEGEAVLRNVPTGTKDLVLTLGPTAFIELLVLDEAGAPIQAYKVARKLDEMGVGESEGGPHPEGRSRVFVHAIPFHLTVSADGFAPREFGPFDLDHFPAELSVTLPRASFIRGRVTEQGSPVNEARVWLRPLTPKDRVVACNGFPSRFDATNDPWEVRTDGEGRFSFSPEGVGPFAIVVETSEHHAAESPDFECPPGLEPPQFELQIQSSCALQGHVLGAPGVSVAGTIVGISHGDMSSRTTVVGEDGGYRFQGLAPGMWWIRRCQVDYSSTGGRSCGYVQGFDPSLQQVEIPDGATTTFDLDLKEASCGLRGHLRSVLASMSHWTARFLDAEGAQTEEHSELKPDGAFEIHPPVLGPQTLVLADDGREDRDQSIEEPLEIRPGANEWGLELSVGALAGDAPPRAVLTHRWKNARGTTCTTHFLVDALGNFRVEGIPAGPGTIELDRKTIPVEVREGETVRVSLR